MFMVFVQLQFKGLFFLFKEEQQLEIPFSLFVFFKKSLISAVLFCSLISFSLLSSLHNFKTGVFSSLKTRDRSLEALGWSHSLLECPAFAESLEDWRGRAVAPHSPLQRALRGQHPPVTSPVL